MIAAGGAGSPVDVSELAAALAPALAPLLAELDTSNGVDETELAAALRAAADNLGAGGATP